MTDASLMLPLAETILYCYAVRNHSVISYLSVLLNRGNAMYTDSGEVFAAGDNKLGQVMCLHAAIYELLVLTKTSIDS